MSYAYNIRNIFTAPQRDVEQMLKESCWACRANPHSKHCECSQKPEAVKPQPQSMASVYPSPEETPPASDLRKGLTWVTNISKGLAGFYREALAELKVTHLVFMGSDLGIQPRDFQGEVLNGHDSVYWHPLIENRNPRKLTDEIFSRACELRNEAEKYIQQHHQCKHGHKHYCGFCGVIANYKTPQ